MCARITNYLVLCVFISLSNAVEPQGYLNINYNSGSGYNNYGFNNGYNKKGYENKGIQLPEFIGNLQSKLVNWNLPYSWFPIDWGYLNKEIGKYIGGSGYAGQVENKGGYSGSGYVKPTTKKPDFSNEPPTTLAPLTKEQQINIAVLDAIVGQPGAAEAALPLLNLNFG